jgi:hypothetical protein
VDCQLTHDGNTLPICFCLFIDGLDEYEANDSEGDHHEMMSLPKSIVSSKNFKACISSRPWPVFIDSFENIASTGRHIELHELTKSDIFKYVADTLGPHIPRINSRRLQESLIRDVTEKAEGVFLWVFLVVQELIQGIRTRDTV